MGVWTSHVARSVFPIAQENGVVAFSPVVVASDLTAIGNFIFRTSHPTDVLIPGGVKVTQEKLGYQRVATIADTVDHASRDGNAVFKKTFADNGIEVVASETFASGDTDFSAQLTRIKESNPEAIFVSAQQIEVIEILTQGRQRGIPSEIPFITTVLSVDEIQSAQIEVIEILTQGRQRGIQIPFITFLSVDEIQSAGDAAEGAIGVSTADTPGNQAFVQNYTTKYGMEPSVWAAQPYAAVYILAKAISDAQSTDSTAIRDALANITDFDTILGKFSFNAVGDAIYDPLY